MCCKRVQYIFHFASFFLEEALCSDIGHQWWSYHSVSQCPLSLLIHSFTRSLVVPRLGSSRADLGVITSVGCCTGCKVHLLIHSFMRKSSGCHGSVAKLERSCSNRCFQNIEICPNWLPPPHPPILAHCSELVDLVTTNATCDKACKLNIFCQCQNFESTSQ